MESSEIDSIQKVGMLESVAYKVHHQLRYDGAEMARGEEDEYSI